MSPHQGTLWGLLAQFPGPGELTTASRTLRERGVTGFDAHTPFPVHGLDEAMGLPESRVPWFVLFLGLGGALGAMTLQWWVASQAYPLRVGGKPFFSWPAFVPITFEVGVLGAALGALLGFLLLARLPRHHHPLFGDPRFERVCDDAFFLSIEASGDGFDRDELTRLLLESGAESVEPIHVD